MLTPKTHSNNPSTFDDTKNSEILAKILKKPQEKLKIHFQPIVNSEKRTVAFEALTKITTEKIHIQQIIENLENSNQVSSIEKLQLAIIFTALKQNSLPQIWFNLTPKSCENLNYIEALTDLCKYYQRKKQIVIGIEITENCTSPINWLKISHSVECLKKAQIKVIMDDFGTKHSNIDSLISIDWDIIKIDGKLIKQIQPHNNIKQEEKVNNILESVLTMCHKMGAKVVAEWVENEYQFQILNKLGFNYFQGFLFREKLRPLTMPPQSTTQFMN